MRLNFPFLLAASNALLKPGDLLRWKKRLIKDARLLLPLTDEDRQDYISASRRVSSVIDKAKAEAWQTTCSSLSPRSNPTSVHSHFCCIAGYPSLSSSSPNFPNCSSPMELASVYAAYLRSHSSVSQPKALHSKAKSYLSELRRTTCPVEYSSFCCPFSPAEFLVVPPTSPRPLPLAQTKLPIPC